MITTRIAMRMMRFVAGALLAALVGLAGGCGGDESKVDPAALETAFKDAPPDATAEAPAAPAEESTTDDSVPIPAGGGAAGSVVPVKDLANRAATAMRKDEVTEAVVLLQTLRRARNLSPEQLTSVQDQMAALQGDLANKAAAGDARAKQALQLIQQSTRW